MRDAVEELPDVALRDEERSIGKSRPILLQMLHGQLMRHIPITPERIASVCQHPFQPVAHIRRHATQDHAVRQPLKRRHLAVRHLAVLASLGDLEHLRRLKRHLPRKHRLAHPFHQLHQLPPPSKISQPAGRVELLLDRHFPTGASLAGGRNKLRPSYGNNCQGPIAKRFNLSAIPLFSRVSSSSCPLSPRRPSPLPGSQ